MPMFQFHNKIDYFQILLVRSQPRVIKQLIGLSSSFQLWLQSLQSWLPSLQLWLLWNRPQFLHTRARPRPRKLEMGYLIFPNFPRLGKSEVGWTRKEINYGVFFWWSTRLLSLQSWLLSLQFWLSSPQPWPPFLREVGMFCSLSHKQCDSA